MKKNIFFKLCLLTLLLSSCSEGDENTEKYSEKTNPKKQVSDSNNTLNAPSNFDSNEKETVDEIVTNEDGEQVQVIKNEEGEKVVFNENESETKVNPESIQLISVTSVNNKSTNTTSQEGKTTDFNIHKYQKLDTFLRKYVSARGNVNYAAIKMNRSELDAIISQFKQSTVKSSWSQNQKLSFWINAYNIFTIKLIVDNYPTSSITKIASKPWQKKIVTIGTDIYSLDYVENGIIRKQFNEPRIHFALNCASESCPILLNKAYKESNLNSLLTSQTKKFLNDTSKNTFSKKEAKISKIFDWYKADFPDVLGFIKKYHSMDYTPKAIAYMEYSWELNK